MGFMVGLWKVGIIFLISVGISNIRHYINIVVVIEETGTMNLAPGKSRTDRWLNQSRLSDVVEKISTDKSKALWLCALGLGVFAFAGIWGISQAGPLQGVADDKYLTFLPEFYYPPQKETIQYPTCRFGKAVDPELKAWSLADYAMLSILAYRNETIVKDSLPIWFGGSGDNVTLIMEPVNTFRKFYDYEQVPGVFYFFKAVTQGGTTGIVSVRGTSSQTEMLVDCQLYLTAFLVQLLRIGLPFGPLFTPLFPHIIRVINSLESTSKKNLYQVLTEFVNLQKKNPEFDDLMLTGHSLGGGLAFLTAAQTHVKAIALSGVNAMMSRFTFGPEAVTVDDLNEYTFNIIPRYDIVPRIDDVAQNFQHIRCLSKSPNFIQCHINTRSLCELLFTCGSGGRPVLCQCTKRFGYPEPKTDGNQSFAEQCADVPLQPDQFSF